MKKLKYLAGIILIMIVIEAFVNNNLSEMTKFWNVAKHLQLGLKLLENKNGVP